LNLASFPALLLPRHPRRGFSRTKEYQYWAAKSHFFSLKVKRKNVRVLIIDDNRDVADSLRLLLEILGHEVRTAYLGMEGVRLAGAWLPAVVLSDIGLPDLSGYAVAQQLRQNEALAGTKLIAITAYGDENTRNR